MKYEVGTKLVCNDIYGVVVPNFKLPGDVCVEWENGLRTSYDADVLDEIAVVVGSFSGDGRMELYQAVGQLMGEWHGEDASTMSSKREEYAKKIVDLCLAFNQNEETVSKCACHDDAKPS